MSASLQASIPLPLWRARAAAELELRARARRKAVAEAPAPSFGEWLGTVTPEWSEHWDYKFLVYVREQLRAMRAGEFDRAMLFMPPRHFKSQMVTVRHSAYVLEMKPTDRVIVGSYNDDLATEFGRQIRAIVEPRVGLQRGAASVKNWKTLVGGGVLSVGVGSGVTGFGGDWIMVDDPIKNRLEANSLTFRDRNYNWFTNDLWTRREPGAKVWITQTRWHPDDLAGRILSEIPEGWRIFRLPAVAESQELRDKWAEEHGQPLGEPDPIGRAEGEVLNPERFDAEWVQDQKNVLGFDFDSLLQQWPRLSSGGIFQEDWFILVDALPNYVKPKEYCRVWDTGATEGGGDYTVGALMMRDRSGLFWVLDIKRGQWGVGERDRIIEETGREDQKRYGLNKLHVLEEPGSSGKSVSFGLQKQMPDLRVVGKRETGSKVTRAEPLAGGMQNGLVRFLRFSGYNALKIELVSFPEGANDDQVDPLAMCYLILAKRTLSSNKPRTLKGGI